MRDRYEKCGGSITPHPEPCATCGGSGAIKAREGNDEIGYEQAWDQCPDCIGGVHLTPHPEAPIVTCKKCGSFVFNEDCTACRQCGAPFPADGGSPTTTPTTAQVDAAREQLYAIAESAYDVERCRPDPEPYPQWIVAAVDAVLDGLGLAEDQQVEEES